MLPENFNEREQAHHKVSQKIKKHLEKFIKEEYHKYIPKGEDNTFVFDKIIDKLTDAIMKDVYDIKQEDIFSYVKTTHIAGIYIKGMIFGFFMDKTDPDYEA